MSGDAPIGRKIWLRTLQGPAARRRGSDEGAKNGQDRTGTVRNRLERSKNHDEE
jgi:hypothetical protein